MKVTMLTIVGWLHYICLESSTKVCKHCYVAIANGKNF